MRRANMRKLTGKRLSLLSKTISTKAERTWPPVPSCQFQKGASQCTMIFQRIHPSLCQGALADMPTTIPQLEIILVTLNQYHSHCEKFTRPQALGNTIQQVPLGLTWSRA